MSNLSRAEEFAHYIIDNNSTIRKTASFYNISKSTVHNDLSKKLRCENYGLYVLVKRILNKNFSEKHIRGGMATKKKYEK